MKGRRRFTISYRFVEVVNIPIFADLVSFARTFKSSAINDTGWYLVDSRQEKKLELILVMTRDVKLFDKTGGSGNFSADLYFALVNYLNNRFNKFSTFLFTSGCCTVNYVNYFHGGTHFMVNKWSRSEM